MSLPRPAPRSSPRILAPAWPSVLTATRDGRHGRLLASRPGRLLPLPTGRQTLPSHLSSQHLQARTAPTVLARSKPAFRMPYAGCARPLQTIVGHLTRLPTDMESVWVIPGVQPGAIGVEVSVNLVLAH